MKYLLINGSPRRKNTYNIIKQIEEGSNDEFEEIHLIEQKIPVCVGCHNCIMEGEDKCPHFKKINPIIEKLNECDGIIIASPVYALNVTALLKNFIDHTAYLYHRPQFFTKKALVVVTTAGAGHKKVASYIDETLRHWGVNKVYKIAIACGERESIDKSEFEKTANKFLSDVESGKLHSPKFGDITFFNVWKAMAFVDEPIKADYEFWTSTGLVNHDFAPEVKLNVFKKLYAKLMFFIFKRIF